MTHQFQSNTTHEAVQLLSEHGFEAMAQAIQVLMNEAMRIERAYYLQADPYERAVGRRSHANGFKPKTFKSRLGKLQLQIPQTRDSQFYPSTLERGERSERALKLALAEMVVQGVSTRKVAAITKELCGLDVSSAQVSRAAKLLDEELDAWRNRKLDPRPVPGSRCQIRKSPSRRHRQRLCRASGHRHSSGWPSKRSGSQLLIERSGSPLAILPGKPAHSWHERGSVHRQ